MSRLGKQLIQIPSNVEIKLDVGCFTVKGTKGELAVYFPSSISVLQDDKTLSIKIANPNNPQDRALQGTIQRLITNCVHGVTVGFSKRLTLFGVGYRASIKDETLNLEVGFSHPVSYHIPKDISIQVEGNNILCISGIDKQKVGEAAGKIRAIKKPEPYKGKGIAYENEVIRRKAGKQAASAGKK